MKKIAVVGIGAIGSIVGGRLTMGGYDVSLICTSWRENAEYMKKHGLTVVGAEGVEKTTKVKSLFIDELALLPGKIDLLLIATKSNDTADCLTKLQPYLAEDGVVISVQNGINEDVIIPIVGKERVIACVSYTGGMLLRPGYVRGHGGKFVVGELDGHITPRVKEIAAILSLVTTTEISNNVIKQRWDKLSQVTMTVTVGAIAGVGFPAILQLEKAHPMLARIMCETLAIARAAGYPLDEVIGLKEADWQRLAKGPAPDLSKIISGPFPPPSAGAKGPNPDESPLLKDIKAGLPLEIEYTNGYVIKKGKELGILTPAHELVVKMLLAMERGEIKPGLDKLDEMLKRTVINR
ncbi:MAG: ketopantoate reductase family protein [Desulfobacteraceae bacterium]|nr:MAG: ketopantoate reductase family protein [Desulfobacteraceae bacterium]